MRDISPQITTCKVFCCTRSLGTPYTHTYRVELSISLFLYFLFLIFLPFVFDFSLIMPIAL